jgi:cell division protein FtsB
LPSDDILAREYLQEEIAQMRRQIEHLNSDSDGIECEARENLHYAKPGEVIVTMPDQPQPQGQAPSDR